MAGLRVGTTSLDVGEEGKWGDSARQKERIEYKINDNRMLVVFLAQNTRCSLLLLLSSRRLVMNFTTAL